MSKRYKILHTQVGAWGRDRIITEDELKAIPGADINRLVMIGAIAPSVEPKTEEPVPPGPDNPPAPAPAAKAPPAPATQETPEPRPGATATRTVQVPGAAAKK